MSPFTNLSKFQPKLEKQYYTFLPNGDVHLFTNTRNLATKRTKDTLDCKQEIINRADRLHISS